MSKAFENDNIINMGLTTKQRDKVFNKYNGRCAYSGTILGSDWEVDHLRPIIRNPVGGTILPQNDNIENLMPAQKIINRYKAAFELETFRNWILGELHLRLKRLPKKPRTEKSIKHKNRLLEVARLFEIDYEEPFSGVFYFERFINCA